MNFTKFGNKAKSMLTLKSSGNCAINASEQSKENQRIARFVLTSALVCLVAFEPSIAVAADATDNLTNAANSILGLLTGTLGKAVATIAVVVMGMMAMFGKLEWERAFKVILGIAIVFGAASIITLIGGTTSIGKI